jgi:HK97 family phage prohead protease
MAKDVYQMLRDGLVKGLSVGYETVRSRDVDGIRHLTELRLWEVSLTAFPACQEALVVGVKSVQQQEQIMSALRMFKADVFRALEKK